jgi:hypothetical protein
MEICDRCERTYDKKPLDCGDRDHWSYYCKLVEKDRDQALAKLKANDFGLGHTTSLVMGDWSRDGHCSSETIMISSNLTKNEIEAAYQVGSEKLGFDFMDEVAADYEDNLLEPTKLKKMVENGLAIDRLFKYDHEREKVQAAIDGRASEEIGLWTESYATIYLFIVKLGNPSFEYEVLPRDVKPEIYIGGYGLFIN